MDFSCCIWSGVEIIQLLDRASEKCLTRNNSRLCVESLEAPPDLSPQPLAPLPRRVIVHQANKQLLEIGEMHKDAMCSRLDVH